MPSGFNTYKTAYRTTSAVYNIGRAVGGQVGRNLKNTAVLGKRFAVLAYLAAKGYKKENYFIQYGVTKEGQYAANRKYSRRNIHILMECIQDQIGGTFVVVGNIENPSPWATKLKVNHRPDDYEKMLILFRYFIRANAGNRDKYKAMISPFEPYLIVSERMFRSTSDGKTSYTPRKSFEPAEIDMTSQRKIDDLAEDWANIFDTMRSHPLYSGSELQDNLVPYAKNAITYGGFNVNKLFNSTNYKQNDYDESTLVKIFNDRYYQNLKHIYEYVIEDVDNRFKNDISNDKDHLNPNKITNRQVAYQFFDNEGNIVNYYYTREQNQEESYNIRNITDKDILAGISTTLTQYYTKRFNTWFESFSEDNPSILLFPYTNINIRWAGSKINQDDDVNRIFEEISESDNFVYTATIDKDNLRKLADMLDGSDKWLDLEHKIKQNDFIMQDNMSLVELSGLVQDIIANDSVYKFNESQPGKDLLFIQDPLGLYTSKDIEITDENGKSTGYTYMDYYLDQAKEYNKRSQ